MSQDLEVLDRYLAGDQARRNRMWIRYRELREAFDTIERNGNRAADTARHRIHAVHGRVPLECLLPKLLRN